MALAKNVEIKFEDNSNKFKADWKDKKQKILYTMGLKWQSICVGIITRNRIVDTGRLRGSLTFITKNKRGDSISRVPENQSDDFLKGSAGENELIVGSNVFYAAHNELNNRKGAFLKPSIMNYREDYENTAEAIMKE